MASHAKKKRNAPIGTVKALLIAFAAFFVYTFGQFFLEPITSLIVPQPQAAVDTSAIADDASAADLLDSIADTVSAASTPEALLASFLGFLVIFVIFVFWYRKFFSINRSKESMSILFKHWFAPKNLLAVVMFAFIVMAANIAAVLILNALFPSMQSFFESIMGEVDASPIWYLVFYVSILGPIGEELCHRGVEMHVLSRTKMPVVLVIIIQAVFFGVMHLIPYQVIYATVVGLFLGYLCYKTRSILPGVMVHIINNSTSTIFSANPVLSSDMIATASDVVVVALGVVGIVLFATKKLTLAPAPTPDLAAFDAERVEKEEEAPVLPERPEE